MNIVKKYLLKKFTVTVQVTEDKKYKMWGRADTKREFMKMVMAMYPNAKIYE